MGLHKKISLVFVSVLIVLAVGSYFGLSGTLTPAFEQLEKRAAHDNLLRAQNGIASHLFALSNSTASWAHWDVAREYVLNKNREFEAENLDKHALLDLDINVMAYFDASGDMLWGMFVDRNSAESLPLSETIIPRESIEFLRQHESAQSLHSGLVASPLGPMLVASWPIVRSDRSGPVTGALVAAKLLDRQQVMELRDTAEVDVDIRNLSLSEIEELQDPESSDMFGNIVERLKPDDRVHYQVLHDIHGRPVTVLTVLFPRDITNLGSNTTKTVLILFAALGTVAIIGLAFVLRLLVVQPISTLRAAMIEIQDGGEISARVNMQRSDEIGDLASSFDKMLDKLDLMKREHVDQSFKAGMAEVAAGVLHNVRNSLMPAINNVALAYDSVNKVSGDNISRSIDELRSSDTSADRKGKLLRYLGMAHSQSNQERAVTGENLRLAMSQLDHATDMLKDQQRFTHARPVIEKVDLSAVLLAARSMAACDDDIDIQIDESLAGIHVLAHRVGLQQVIGNILANACESIECSGALHGRIDASAVTESNDDGDSEVHLSIRDNGSGLGHDELQHVFDRGFTTKDSNSGLGLHWSANALAGMKGHITASSDGRDKGAVFTISLKAA